MSFSWQNVWLPFVTLSGAASGALLVSGFARREPARRSGAHGSIGVSDGPNVPPPHGLGTLRTTAELLDAEREIVAAAQEVAALAAESSVRLETAIQPGLTVWADQAGLRRMLAAPLRAAIARSGGGRVLVGAGRHGGRMQISVLDDGVPTDRAIQEAELREVAGLIALRGGTLEVSVRANAGTAVVIRLPEPAAAPAPAPVSDSAPIPAPQGAASPDVAAAPTA
ncbi:MAG TPA: hypothetical protein VJ779_22395 [Acetobacteraceae bacterium]|nr:hypothetical protein [Acetobacteraceae bacterium]